MGNRMNFFMLIGCESEQGGGHCQGHRQRNHFGCQRQDDESQQEQKIFGKTCKTSKISKISKTIKTSKTSKTSQSYCGILAANTKMMRANKSKKDLIR